MESDFDKVICPNCVHQFRAIPVNVQDELREAAAEIERLRAALEKAAQIAMDTGRAMSDGYKINHCTFCQDGEIAAENVGYLVAKAIRETLMETGKT